MFSINFEKLEEKTIFEHLKKCDKNFIPPLSHRICLQEYSKKLADKATIVCAKNSDRIVGMIATYINPNEKSGFISNVSIEKPYVGRGIASILMNKLITYSIEINLNKLILEVHCENSNAMRLYKKFNFTPEKQINDIILMQKNIRRNERL